MDESKKILVVEDDETIAFGIKVFLEKRGFSLVCSDTILSAKEELQKDRNFNLALLDLNLPDGSGYEFCSFIKDRIDVPVIFLTVRDEEKDIVKGLDMGADDYIVKPFKLSVLLSRINAVLRRSSGIVTKNILTCGVITLDKSKTKVLYRGKEIELTAGEYRLLLMLLENKNQTLTRSILLQKLWDSNGDFVNDNTLTVTMKRLREKLGNPSAIITIRGIGYRVEDDDE